MKKRYGEPIIRPLRIFGKLRESARGNVANPRLAAGCNKPANRITEQAVEVVRNHESGPRLTK